MIPPYLEIEADNPDEVRQVAILLGYDETRLTSENTTKVYLRHGIDLRSHDILTFS
jgi:adenylate cyclase, class 2